MSPEQEAAHAFHEAFGQPPLVLARAPGRVEFIGNHTDYNGGQVLGAAIDRYLVVALSPTPGERIRLLSNEGLKPLAFRLGASPLSEGCTWANYPLGVVWALREGGHSLPSGFDLAVTSNLPAGAGLSSSAAFELATLTALDAAFGLGLDPRASALLAQKAENDFVGVPCGILDQASSAFGRADHLVHIDCAQLSFHTVPMPHNLHFWIFNTRLKHTLSLSPYAVRRSECTAAFAHLRQRFPDAPNLASLTPGQVEAAASGMEPAHKRRALHVTSENARVIEMSEVLPRGDLSRAGQLLYASHESSRDLFENSIPELDALVELLRGRDHVIGARLTGGGFGGAVMALTTAAFTEAHGEEVLAAFRQRFPALSPEVFHARPADGAGLLVAN